MVFKALDKVRCVHSQASDLEEGNIYYISKVLDGGIVMVVGSPKTYNRNRFEKVEDNMEKTFREVIADIKEGEVWVNETINRKITIGRFNEIEVSKVDGSATPQMKAIIFNLETKYTLQRNQYTFEEAFKAYEDGKEIESLINNYKYKKEGFGTRVFPRGYKTNIECPLVCDGQSCFDIDAIRGKWYINN